MKSPSKQRKGLMGSLNNSVVGLIDKSQLTPPEVVIVLRLLANEIEQAFFAQQRREKE